MGTSIYLSGVELGDAAAQEHEASASQAGGAGEQLPYEDVPRFTMPLLAILTIND